MCVSVFLSQVVTKAMTTGWKGCTVSDAVMELLVLVLLWDVLLLPVLERPYCMSSFCQWHVLPSLDA